MLEKLRMECELKALQARLEYDRKLLQNDNPQEEGHDSSHGKAAHARLLCPTESKG